MREALHADGACFIHTLKDVGCDGFSGPTSPISHHAIVRVRNDTGCLRGLRFGKYRWYVVGNISGFTPALPDLVAEGDGSLTLSRDDGAAEGLARVKLAG